MCRHVTWLIVRTVTYYRLRIGIAEKIWWWWTKPEPLMTFLWFKSVYIPNNNNNKKFPVFFPLLCCLPEKDYIYLSLQFYVWIVLWLWAQNKQKKKRGRKKRRYRNLFKVCALSALCMLACEWMCHFITKQYRKNCVLKYLLFHYALLERNIKRFRSKSCHVIQTDRKCAYYATRTLQIHLQQDDRNRSNAH